MPNSDNLRERESWDVRNETGIEGLDYILHGGLPKGHFYLVEGEPGTGKTTLGLQFLLEGARAGEKVMYVTLSESRRELEGVARSHSWSLDKMVLLEYSAREEDLRPEDQYSVFHPSEIELQDTMEKLLREFEKVQPERLVLDSMSEIRLLARDPLRYRRQILALKNYFANRDCTVLLLDGQSSNGKLIELQSLAHGVIALESRLRDIGGTRRRVHIKKLRGSLFREGYHDYRIRTGGIDVFPRLVAADHSSDPRNGIISSGIDDLDALWGGGLRRGSSTLLIGPAGAGKSSVAAAYATAAARNGAPVAIYSFDEPVASVLYRADKLGMDATALMRNGALYIEQVNPVEQSAGEFIYGVTERVEATGTDMVVIDSLNGFLHTIQNEDHLASRIHELLIYLNQKGVTGILIQAQAELVGSGMTTIVDVSYLADNVMLFRYFEASGKVRKAVSVIKMRGGQHEYYIRELRIFQNRLIIGAPLENFHGVLTGVPVYTGTSETLEQASQSAREEVRKESSDDSGAS